MTVLPFGVGSRQERSNMSGRSRWSGGDHLDGDQDSGDEDVDDEDKGGTP